MGRKRHILVDTLGLILAVVVHAGDIQDRDGARLVLQKLTTAFGWLRLIWVDGGHAGTALSAALGMATARDLMGTNEHVVDVCGDAAFTCGITLEALNNVVASPKRLVVVLNANQWSIARNVGAMAK